MSTVPFIMDDKGRVVIEFSAFFRNAVKANGSCVKYDDNTGMVAPEGLAEVVENLLYESGCRTYVHY